MTIGQPDWAGKTGDERRAFLDDRHRGKPRDTSNQFVEAASLVIIGNFINGVQNAIGPFKGSAAIPANPPDPAVPARGNPNKWYAKIREAEDIELPANVQVADETEAQEVCGIWFGDAG